MGVVVVAVYGRRRKGGERGRSGHGESTMRRKKKVIKQP